MELYCCSLLMAGRVGGALVLFTTDGGSCWCSSSVVNY